MLGTDIVQFKNFLASFISLQSSTLTPEKGSLMRYPLIVIKKITRILNQLFEQHESNFYQTIPNSEQGYQ